MRLDYHGARSWVRMSASTRGLGVVFHKEGELRAPYTDGGNIHVTEPNACWTEEQWIAWEYELEHEIGHESEENYHPYWKDLMKEKDISTNSFFGNLWNLVEDSTQEHNRFGKYSGRDDRLCKGRNLFTQERLLSDEAMQREYETPEGKAFRAVAMHDVIERGSWNKLLAGVGSVGKLALPDDEQEMMDKIEHIRIRDCKNGLDSYQAVRDILEALGYDPDEEEQKGKGKGKGEGEGEGKGKGGRGEGEPAEGSGDGEPEYSDLLMHKHYEKPEYDGADKYNKSWAGQHIEYDDKHDAYADGFVPSDPVILDLSKDELNGYRDDPYYTSSAARMIENVQGGDMLASQVKMLLTSMKQSKWQHGHKRGRISGKNLWKASKGGGYQQEVFKRKVQKLELNTAVTILTDNSGSMSGDKFAHAAKAGVMLNEALVKIGVPVELLSFSEDGRGALDIIVSPFHEIAVSEEELTRRYAMCTNWMCQNSDGESIQWAYNRLIKRPEKRKVLIVLSDGSPAAFNPSGSEVGFTKRVIKEIEETGRAEIYGIGIMDSNVQKFYTHHKVLHESNELEDMLLGLVKNKVMGIG